MDSMSTARKCTLPITTPIATTTLLSCLINPVSHKTVRRQGAWLLTLRRKKCGPRRVRCDIRCSALVMPCIYTSYHQMRALQCGFNIINPGKCDRI